MSLPWVRLDSHIASHDKILSLTSDPSPKRWQAAASYMFALGWSGQHGTDGAIPRTALPFIHATTTTARLLVMHGLWVETLTGWQIVNYADRQQLARVTAAKTKQASEAGQKANCARWHGSACWSPTLGCTKDVDT